jgi:hypothetical protein
MNEWQTEYLEKISSLAQEAQGYYEKNKTRSNKLTIILIIVTSLLLLNFALDGIEHFSDLMQFYHQYVCH